MTEQDSFLDEVLDEIETNPELSLFFKRLFENPSYQRLFFIHKDILFPLLNSIRIPCLFWNSLDDSSKAKEHLRLISTSMELQEIKKEQVYNIIGWTLLGVTDVIKDLIIYGVIRFVRDNLEVKDLVNSEEFSFMKMKQVLGDYSRLNLKILEELPLDETKVETIKDPLLKSNLNRLIKTAKQGFKKISGELFISIIPDIFPDLLTYIHVGGYNILNNLLQVCGLQRHEYEELLTELHSLKLISNLHSIFWCVNCIDNPIILRTRSELSPHHLKMSCPRCGKLMMMSTAYYLDSILEGSILSKNGLLGVAVAWLLEKNQLEYSAEVYNEYEYDFIVNNKILIECKMHRNDNINERNVSMWFEQDIKQLSNHFEKAKNKGTKYAILVYNFEVTPYKVIADEIVRKSCPGAIITDYTQLPAIIEKLKIKS
jgi:hypothetical protein